MKEACKDQRFTEEVQKDWLAYNHHEVMEHFPPQLIIGKQTADDVQFLVHDEDPLVKVVISEVPCEYNYSNPTGIFNLSIPHIEVRTNMYTTQSYRQSKQREYEELKKVREDKAKEDKAENEKTNDNDNIEVAVDPQEV